MIMVAVGCVDPKTTAPTSDQAVLAHELLDALMIKAMAASFELVSHARTSVASFKLRKDTFKKASLLVQALVAVNVFLSFEPRVIGATSQLQSPTELADR